MAFTGFPPEAFGFLRDLSRNNEKKWFDAHRDIYTDALLEPGRDLVEDLGQRLQTLGKHINFDPRVGGSIFRIYRDTRFKTDKRPYKDHFDFWFWQGVGRSGDEPGYWLRLTADSVAFGAGSHWLHDGETLERYREAVADPKRGAALDRLLKKLAAAGAYEVGGGHYKRVPKPYDPDHPQAELLKHHALYAGLELAPPPPEVHTAAFVELCIERYRPLVPLQEWVYRVVSGG